MSQIIIDFRSDKVGKKKYYVRRSALDPRKRRTSIIVSHRNIHRLLTLGKYGETYNDIVKKIIDFDIYLEKLRYEKRKKR